MERLLSRGPRCGSANFSAVLVGYERFYGIDILASSTSNGISSGMPDSLDSLPLFSTNRRGASVEGDELRLCAGSGVPFVDIVRRFELVW